MNYTEEQQFLYDVMTIAVEGGINDWAAIRNVKRDEELNVLQFDCRDSEDKTAHWEGIDADRVKTAILHIIAWNVEIRNTTRQLIVESWNEKDAGILDADDCDCIIQVAAFGEIVFG